GIRGFHVTGVQTSALPIWIMGFIEAGRRTANMVCGGRQVTVGGRGLYVEPTIFDDVAHHDPLAREEIFGPVLSVIPFDTEEEARSEERRAGKASGGEGTAQ